MKINNPKNKNGDTIVFKTSVSNIYDNYGINLPDKIDDIASRITGLTSSISSFNLQIDEINSTTTQSDPTIGVLKRSGTENICLLTDNRGVVTSDYGFTYEKLSAILATGNYSDYIKTGDYIILTTTDDGVYTLYAEVDTYYGKGDSKKTIEHHIDFIASELIKGSTGWVFTYRNNNNGSSVEQSPFLAQTIEYLSYAIVDRLNSYLVDYFPNELKSHIVKKYHNVPERYDSSSVKTYEGTCTWKQMTYLWLPYEKEIFGTNTHAYTSRESHMIQYKIFTTSSNRVKRDSSTSSVAIPWWTASARVDDGTNIIVVTNNGSSSYAEPYTETQGVPLCFRFV